MLNPKKNYYNVEEASTLLLWVIPVDHGDVFTIEVKQIYYNIPMQLQQMQVVTSVISNNNNECFRMAHDFADNNGKPKDNITYIVHGYSYTCNAYVYIYNTQTNKHS